jgi:hypothetical protein
MFSPENPFASSVLLWQMNRQQLAVQEPELAKKPIAVRADRAVYPSTTAGTMQQEGNLLL